MDSTPDPNTAAPTPPAAWYRRTTARRIATGAWFIPAFIVVTRMGGYAFLAFVDLVIVLGMLEFYGMMRKKGIQPYRGIGVLCGVTLSTYYYFRSGLYANFFLTFVVIALMGLELTRRDGRLAVYHVSTTVFGVIYVAFLASHMILLRELPRLVGLPYSEGASFVFLAFMVTWASDTGAFAVGSLLGRTPLLTRVSRNKTWEGALGGMAFGALAGWIASVTFAPYLDAARAIAVGALASLVGLLGDLFESMLKRDAEVKDSGRIISGHGGVLDRFDSLLFTVPLIYYFLKFVIFQ
ncbi:MAG: phosphatidate cytidylyltransferase [Candidatus Krumholzibacteria bacterium]|nr:phosphatidate cytidylyltransferase [Candidatus Krumholzibacteria bacterium]MDH4336203.1 phosphatidate cytidylyltransferase [Candidatus Krumholzibacteria bacterium]MDH5268844.1 phosphatidate cytidylyltransferase [Candidatus Krumholzibacteria bacterium]